MSALSVDQKREALEARLKRSLTKMPAIQVEDLYANRFHGPENPMYYETVVDGVTVPTWKVRVQHPEPEPPAEGEATEA